MDKDTGARVAKSAPAASGGPAAPRDDAFDIVILGAGISGLVGASVLAAAGRERILVIDEYDRIGGNHIDRAIGDYTFDIGSFIFQDDSPLLDHFPELLPLYVPIEPTWARLNPQGVVTAYPISIRQDILGAGLGGLTRILGSLAYARAFQRRQENARDFARFWIGGQLLHRSGLEHYMARFYGVPPTEIDLDLARKRMLWISEHASLRGLARRFLRPAAARGATNRQMARPRAGFAPLYEAARARLEAAGVSFHLGARLHSVSKAAAGFSIATDDRSIVARRLISTIPLQRMAALCGLSGGTELRTITLVSLFFSHAGERGFPQSILYNFSHEGAWKRITVYSDFYGRVDGRDYFTAEVIGRHVDDRADLAEEDFRRHIRANGLFGGDLRLEGSFRLENAYPIYSRRSAAAAAGTIQALAALGVESFGRQGAFNYQPTARVSTIEAEASLGAARPA